MVYANQRLGSQRRCLLITVICGMFIFAIIMPAVAQRPQQKKKSPPKPPPIRLPESVRQKSSISMDVAAVNPSSRHRVQGTADSIDRFVNQVLAAKGKVPNALASDEVFVRRVYLDVAGRIPTFHEARGFLESKAPDKRVQLIDDLLEQPDYVLNLYNMWADILRLTERPDNNMIADPYLEYVKDSIRTNKPYDQWVYEMLTADGKLWDNPAVGFQLRDHGQPLPYVDNTVRVFLGTQIGCAQCHDHPFDVWTQLDFYRLAAFTAGVRTRMDRSDPEFKSGNRASQLISEARKKYPNGRVPGEYQRLVRANTYRVKEVEQKLKLPHDYAYSNAKPNQLVQPAVLWGEIPENASSSSPRQQFAAWVTSADNKLFSKTVANRYWRRFFGVGLVEPVDDFSDENTCSNDELLEFLAKEMVRLNFDQKEFIRSILYSQSYQREASAFDTSSGELYYFPGPLLRRMSAEQVWDSILTLTVYNPLPFQRPAAGDMRSIVDLDLGTATMQDVERHAARFKETYDSYRYKRSLNKHAYKGNVLCRASELPTPLPPDHFLRQFGQGDRETISAGQTEATVPQILTMFNGPITHVMLETGSVLYDQVIGSATPREAIDSVFISVLGRLPTPQDRVEAVREFAAAESRGLGFGNLIWALLNTREFLFVQ